MRYKKNVGDFGEEFAAKMLENAGYQIIGRNYATKFGELDIIALRGGTIHFIEVKTRTSLDCGYPSDSVTQYKRERIRKAAKCYLNSRRYQWKNISFDVYEVLSELIEDCM
jgi:putative endonuclease